MDAEEALKMTGRAVAELMEQGRFVEAAEVLFEKALAPLIELVRKNAEQIAETDARLSARIEEVDARLSARIEELSAKIEETNARLSARMEELSARVEEVDARLGARMEQLSDAVSRLAGETGRLKGWEVEIKVARMLVDWFKRRAPEYDVVWWAGPGADLLIQGEEIMAAVDITAVPKEEDVWQLKRGIGAVKTAWGKAPDVLVIYSHSGVIPEDVAELAEQLDVKIVRGPKELKDILDQRNNLKSK